MAEKTGYPPDMLDLDLDLEADLGVDTVKQAEFRGGAGGVRDRSATRSCKLRDFPTLDHVDRLRGEASQTGGTGHCRWPHRPPVAAQPVEAAQPAAGRGSLRRMRSPARWWRSWPSMTGYPPDMLDLDLDLEADLGVDTVKQAECSRRCGEAFGVAARRDH